MGLGDVVKRVKVFLEGEEFELVLRRVNQGRKVVKFCKWCKKHLDHHPHADDDQNHYYLCENCDTPN